MLISCDRGSTLRPALKVKFTDPLRPWDHTTTISNALELKIDCLICAKNDYCIWCNEWDVWEHHLQHTQCAAHAQGDCSPLAREEKLFLVYMKWSIQLFLVFVSSHDAAPIRQGLSAKEAIVFVKELVSSVSMKSLPASDAVGWHHCLVWDYSFSVAEPSMVKSQTVCG